jgi:hypothetical protein
VPWHFYVAAISIAAFGLAAAVTASPQWPRERDVLWRDLLMSGVLATMSTATVIAYPHLGDLLHLQIWTIAVLGFAAGVLRGATMAITTDHLSRIVILRNGRDGFLVALLFAFFAIVQAGVEVWLGKENPYEPTSEFLMVLLSFFLLGRSIAAFHRARTLPHMDLRGQS